MRKMMISTSVMALCAFSSGTAQSRPPRQVLHYDILIPMPLLKQEGHFVVRTSSEFARLQEVFGGRAWWESMEIVAPNFDQSMAVGIAIQQDGCGPLSLIRNLFVESDTLKVEFEGPDILGPCNSFFSWLELAVFARHDDRAVVFISPDAQWAGVPYVAREINLQQ
jgi:hypothetical protein